MEHTDEGVEHTDEGVEHTNEGAVSWTATKGDQIHTACLLAHLLGDSLKDARLQVHPLEECTHDT